MERSIVLIFLLIGVLLSLVSCSSGGGGGGGSPPPSSASGTLDSAFGGDIDLDGLPDGFVVHDSAAAGSGNDVGNSITLDSLGLILVTGYSFNPAGNTDLAIWRYTDTGDLDATFGGDINLDGTPDGFIVHDNAAAGSGNDVGNSITLDSLGMILVTGYSLNSAGNTDMAIWRYTDTGVLDTTFGGDINLDGTPDGFVVHNSAAGGSSNDGGFSIILDSSDRVYVAGYSYNASRNTDMVIWRYTDTGALDTTFGGDINLDGTPDGFVVHSDAAGGTNSSDIGYSITLDPLGRIYVAGKSINPAANNDMVVWRYTAAGVLDTTFGVNGIVIHNGAAGGNNNDYGHSITLDPLNRIYVAGSSDNAAGDNDMALWRYTDTGNLDITFGGDINLDGTPDGFVVHNDAAGGDSYDTGKSIALDTLGRIYVTGNSINVAGNMDMVLWCYDDSGALETAFGGDINSDGTPDGFVVHDSAAGGAGIEVGNSVTLDSLNKVLVAGNSLNVAGNSDMVVWKYE